MYPSDEDPTSVMPVVVPPRPLGHRSRVAATGVAAVLIAAGGAGIGGCHRWGPDHEHHHERRRHQNSKGRPVPSSGAAISTARTPLAQTPNLPDVVRESTAAGRCGRPAGAHGSCYRCICRSREGAGRGGVRPVGQPLRAPEQSTRSSPRVWGGSTPGPPAEPGPGLHVANKANRHDGRFIQRPRTLMYEYQGHNAGPVGVMYTANES